MTEKTVETEVQVIEEQNIMFCNSCGEPIEEDVDQLVSESEARNVMRQERRDASEEIHTAIKELRKEMQEMLLVDDPPEYGTTSTSQSWAYVQIEPDEILSHRELDGDDLFMQISEALKELRKETDDALFQKAEFDNDYHFCSTCRKGLDDMDLALGAATAGQLRERLQEQQQQDESRDRDAGMWNVVMVTSIVVSALAAVMTVFSLPFANYAVGAFALIGIQLLLDLFWNTS